MIPRLARFISRINPLSDPTLRHGWVYLRALYFVRLRGRLRTLDSEKAVAANITHNKRSIYSANARMNLLLFPLAIIETLNSRSKVLVIGPRNEFDLYTLAALGFELANVVGLDLMSYSPRIALGDMHSIPFNDNMFDAVVCGWTLSYSIEPRRAAREMARVTRQGGILAIGVEYSRLDGEGEQKLLGYRLQEQNETGKRVNSTADIRELFEGEVGHVYFEHDAPRKASHSAEGFAADVSNVALVFSRASHGEAARSKGTCG